MDLFYGFEAAWGIFELVNVGVIAVLSLLIIYILNKHRKDKAPLFAWAINLKKSKKQVEILMAATVISLFVFSLYIIGEFLSLLCSEETAVNFRNERVIILGSRKDLGSIAKNLFSSLRKLDTFNVDIGFIESFDEHGIGLPIMNRLIKASVGNIVGHRGDLLKIFNSG